MIATARTLVVTVLIAAASASAALAADPLEVFIDGRDPAFLVIQGVAENTSDQARREMAGYATLEGVSLVSWNAFRQNAQALVAPHVIKDEYPGASTVPGLVALVKAYPGKPFAITWNGGLAVTFQDYQHAVTTHKAFSANAERYERGRPADPRLDPVNPQNQLAALLNR